MFDKEAIQQLQEGASIEAADAAISRVENVAALPNHFNLHDLEQYNATRRRARGCMNTQHVADFVAYASANAELGASTFVESAQMRATAVLNLGTPEEPGHADNLASLVLEQTAAYKALLQITSGKRSQRDVAEYLEDWPDLIECFNADGAIKPPQAVAAVRKVTIEALRKLENEEQSLGATRSAFESVQASSKEPLPTHIYVKLQPYADLTERTFVLRLGVLTDNDKPSIQLRVIKAEQHAEEMATELANKLRDAFSSRQNAMPVLLGSYQKAR